MRPVVVNRAFPEAVAEVEKIVPVTLIVLLADGHQVIGEYPDVATAAAPEYQDGRNEGGIISKVERVIFQLEPSEQEVFNPEVSPPSLV